MTTYRLTQAFADLPAGAIVYPFDGNTYGILGDDTRFSGEPHAAITRTNDPGAPFLSVPVRIMEPVTGTTNA